MFVENLGWKERKRQNEVMQQNMKLKKRIFLPVLHSSYHADFHSPRSIIFFKEYIFCGQGLQVIYNHQICHLRLDDTFAR